MKIEINDNSYQINLTKLCKANLKKWSSSLKKRNLLNTIDSQFNDCLSLGTEKPTLIKRLGTIEDLEFGIVRTKNGDYHLTII